MNPDRDASKQKLTEQDIRPEALMDRQAELFACDVARLIAQQSQFVNVDCPACSNNNATEAFIKTGMKFVCCGHCETLYANPRPNAELLQDFYGNSKNYQYWSEVVFPASEEKRREKIFLPRVQKVLDITRYYQIKQQVLLEVGAGFGLFCEEIRKTNQFDQVIGVEPTPSLASDCRKKGLTVIEKPVEQLLPEEIAGGRLANVIVSFEVIEHLFSPGDFLQKCMTLLAPGGILIVSCPNANGFDIKLLQSKSSAVDVEHLNLFTPGSLSQLMQWSGFSVLDIQTPGELDAELVRKAFMNKTVNPDEHPFFKQILLDGWQQYGDAFQQFLVENKLSSHLLMVAQKPD